MTATLQRIAVIRTCALGDAVQCTPLLRQIRADSPGARITFFTSANAVCLFQGAPFIDEVVGIPSEHLTIPAGRIGLLRAWWQVACHGKFDALISLEPTWVRNLGTLLVSAPVKAGFTFSGKRKPFELFNSSVQIAGDSRGIKTHTSQYYLDLWLGLARKTDRGFGYDMRHLVDRSVAGSTNSPKMICLAPGTGNLFGQLRTKQWPVGAFVELGSRLLQDGWDVSYVGGAGDLGGEGVPAGCTNLLGATTLREVANVLQQSAVMVGNDSGLFHLAQALGCPAIGIFGPTSPEFTGVFRAQNAVTLKAALPCMPCYRDTCDAEEPLPRPCCMSAVTVNDVLRSVEAFARPMNQPL